jgi:hypothetical protein
MKTNKELTIYDIENWAKEVEKFPKRKLTDEEVEGFLKYSMNEDRINEDKEIIRLLDEKKGGMASVIWLRIKHCHTYSITPALAVYLAEIISSFGISTMMCNYLQYMAYKHKQKVIDFKTFGIKIFPMGFISDTDWQKAWDMQKIINDNEGSDNMLDNSFCMQSIREL